LGVCQHAILDGSSRPEKSGTNIIDAFFHPDRAMRKTAFDTFWKAYGQYENSLGAFLARMNQIMDELEKLL
jgi:oligoendopeptidase F